MTPPARRAAARGGRGPGPSSYEYAQRAYTNLVEGLYRLDATTSSTAAGRRAGLCSRVRLRLPRVQPGGPPLHAGDPAGALDEARGRLRRLLPARTRGAGQLRPVAPGPLLARKGDPAATALLSRPANGRPDHSVQPIALAGIARVEAAWLAGDHAAAAELAGSRWSAPRAAVRALPGRAAALPGRCGHPVDAPAGCPPEFALGIGGDWAGAAARWRALGAPYEHALELAASGRQPECGVAGHPRPARRRPPRPTWSAATCAGWASSHLPRRPSHRTRTNPPASPTVSSRSLSCSPRA